MVDRIRFRVNGIEYSVGGEVSSDMMLVDYLRDVLELRGTKYMCREAGCGACIINASTSPGSPTKAINSCITSVTSCHGWDITTIEGLGGKHVGYHPLQKKVAEFNATQCGHCTPGWVMNMNGLLQTKKQVTMLEVEHAFGGNICRCTGYRPLMECFKKFAIDAPKEDRIIDIENLDICRKTGKKCNKKKCSDDDDDDWCFVQEKDVEENFKRITLKDGKIWFRPNNLADVLSILQYNSSKVSYMLVAGNSAKGVVPIFEYPHLLIDISHLQELKINYMDQNLIVGAGNTLSEFLDILKEHSAHEYFGYCQKLHDHVTLIAHIPVRNVGTIGGNLMIKYLNNSFQSDIFLLLETVGAQLTIIDIHGTKACYTMQNFLKIDMTNKVIVNVLLPPLSQEYLLTTFKIMPRAQSAHAIVNAGFLYKMHHPTGTVLEARIVYGALSPKFIRAHATEVYLVGKQLFINETLQGALKVLEAELIVEEHLPEPTVEYRRHLAKALFFKGLLTLCPASIFGPRVKSGPVRLHESRGVSSGKQIFTTNPSLWPLNQPIVKVEALYQSAGEAVYVEDISSIPNEVYAAFVLSTVPVGTIVSIDASVALGLQGVLAFYTAKDIPGLNSFTPADSLLYSSNEEVLAEGTVKHYDQPIGIIVAETRAIADRAAKLVKVKYSNLIKPILDIKKAITDKARNTMVFSADATDKGTDILRVIKGDNTLYGQYHFTMETLVTVVKPTEEGLEVHSATQWIDGTQVTISRALGIDQNRIDVHLRRIGGGYGFKISRSIQSAIACSLVSYKLNRPCRFIQSLTTNMKAIGKRLPSRSEYEVAVNKSGVIQYINLTMYEDNGYKVNETLSALAIEVFNNCYDVTKYTYKIMDTITDTAKNTWCRSPATLEAIAFNEIIMERISYELSLDPVAVRLANLDKDSKKDITEMVDQLKKDADYDSRKAEVNTFNTQNRWKKRGIRFSFARWAPTGAQRVDVNLSVYHGDGSIVVTHAGVEMGQGINTKAVQIVAYFLKVPVNKIQIKANNTIIAPNGFISGGSLTTTSIIFGLRRCCDQLLERLAPIRATLTDPTWEVLIKTAYNSDVDLQVHGFASNLDVQKYNIYGVALTEVEIDCLTGEYNIRRVDLLQDVGLSLSPEVDIGQVEGGFVMGLGYWTCERLVYEPNTGRILTDRSWDYHVPEARDIPQVFNIYLKKNSYSNELILGSKATGEPATCAAVGVTFALREAIAMARQEIGIPTTEWFNIDGPFSTEAVCLATKTRIEDFKFY